MSPNGTIGDSKMYYTMKLNKLFTLLLLAILMAGATGCGSDDDDKINQNASLLQGETWTFKKAVVDVMGQSIEMNLRQIRDMYSSQLGTSNIMFIDEHLKFEEEYMVMVNTGDRLKYKYYSNGTLWIEGLDDLDEISINIRIKSLTQSQLVLTYNLSVEGISIKEDIYYTR